MSLALAWIRWLTFGMILLAAAEVAAAGDNHVYKFVSARRLGVSGRDHLVIIAEPAGGGHTARLVVPNTDPDKYSPAPESADAVKSMAAGQMILVQTHADKGEIDVESVGPWTPRAGEDTPKGYVFLRGGPTEKPGELRITLAKYGEPMELTVPAQVDAHGAAAPDPDIDAELKNVHEGDVVWAEVIPGKTPALAAILPWADPQQGKLLRVAPADVDGQKGFAAEIATDEKPITALIPMKQVGGKAASDPRLLAAARKISNGAAIRFRTREAGGQTWLMEIELPPKEPAPVAQRQNAAPPPAGIPVRSAGGGVPGVGGLPGGF